MLKFNNAHNYVGGGAQTLRLTIQSRKEEWLRSSRSSFRKKGGEGLNVFAPFERLGGVTYEN